MSPRPVSEVDSLDDAINNFQKVATILRGQSFIGIYNIICLNICEVTYIYLTLEQLLE